MRAKLRRDFPLNEGAQVHQTVSKMSDAGGMMSSVLPAPPHKIQSCYLVLFSGYFVFSGFQFSVDHIALFCISYNICFRRFLSLANVVFGSQPYDSAALVVIAL